MNKRQKKKNNKKPEESMKLLEAVNVISKFMHEQGKAMLFMGYDGANLVDGKVFQRYALYTHDKAISIKSDWYLVEEN
ncbi:hypothetical protein D3C74_49420 [compost metagenome]